MRKLVLGLLAAGSAVAVAAPASAQYYPEPYGYGYGYGYDNGYNRGYADPGSLHRRIENVLKSVGGVRPDQRRQLYSQAVNLDRALRAAARDGFSPWEHQQFDQRVYQLERYQGWASMNRGRRYYDGHEGYYSDRDRRGHDGRWDRDDDDD